ncbi:MAG: carboxypeptidase regulatory-like domain-containing protein [Myxococcales bacterium]|nr:MAG: carboxypeptidase regulatory-like domain-containing protein [Myxococcales bacterium]
MWELRNWIMLGAGCAAAVLVAFGGVSAETVEGSVQGYKGTEASSESKSKDYYWKVWNGALPEQRDKNDHNDVLAVLTGKFTGPPIGCRFSFRGGGLDPSTIAARSGTTIRIDNRDAFTHELSVKGLPGFTPLESGPGKARAIPVPAGGPWQVGDLIYGHVDGHLHSMRELVACASVTSSGRFRFDNVPPGPYSLRILRGSEQVAMRRVTVPAGRTLKVDPLSMSKSRRK